MKKITAALLCSIMALSLLAACSGKRESEPARVPETPAPPEVSEEFRAVVDEFSRLYLELDAEGARFDAVLAATGGYLEGELGQQKAQEILEKLLKECRDRRAQFREYQVEDGLARQLASCGISAEEFAMFANLRANELFGQETDITALLEYLSHAEEFAHSREALQVYHDADMTVQDAKRGYYYYSSYNYWFAGAGGAETAYVREKMSGAVRAYVPESPMWFTDQDELESCVIGELDKIEEVRGVLSEYLGKTQEDLYQAEQDYQALQKEYEQTLALEEILVRLREIAQRVQEIQDAAAQAREQGDEGRLAELQAEFEGLVAEYGELRERADAIAGQ